MSPSPFIKEQLTKELAADVCKTDLVGASMNELTIGNLI